MGHYKSKDIDIQNNEPMKKFKVEVIETLSRIVEIEARDEEDAIELVQEMYNNEEIVLDGGNDCYRDIEFEIVE